jgi:membrane protease YdiL (CAAX protease family)
LEEIAIRGLVMVALVAAWGHTTRGLIKSVLLSSLIFAAMHLVNVLGGNPLPIVLLQGAGAFFLGVLLCALLLSGRSIYPVVFLHGLLNIGSFLLLSASPSAATTPSAWLLQSALSLPFAIFGLFLLRGVLTRPLAPNPA